MKLFNKKILTFILAVLMILGLIPMAFFTTQAAETTTTNLCQDGHNYSRKVKSIAHRGYSIGAPENTLPAFVMAKEKGFYYVECDVSLTSDDVPVLMHLEDISHTSNGTGLVTQMTYSELLQYDYGSWKGPEFKGTKIPTFEEFIALCAELDLHPYIELKLGYFTREKIYQLMDIVKKYDMLRQCTWVSAHHHLGIYITEYDPYARIGLFWGNVDTQLINDAIEVRTATNDVFLDVNYTSLNKNDIELVKNNGFALEVFTVNDADALLKLPKYVTGVITDGLHADTVFTGPVGEVTSPTCTERGYTTYTCADCGYEYVDNYVSPTDHKAMVRYHIKNQTCGEDGEWLLKCLHCDYSKTLPIPATNDHSYDNDCDTDCNTCGTVRLVSAHAYDNACDTNCNVCNNLRAVPSHTYKKNKTTKATTSKNGKKYYTCEECGKEKITTIYKVSRVYLSTEEYTYNGKTKKPSVKVYDSKGKKLTEGDDYKISRPSSSKKVGKYKIKVTFKGDYTGTKTLSYTINPKGTKVSSVTAAKKSLKVKIAKQSTQTTGYEIQYSTSKTFKAKYTKTKKVTSYKTTSVTLKSLKAKKTYYVRVRTYKTVDGKKYYSDWSKSVKKKTK